MNLQEFRQSYQLGHLRRRDLESHPIDQFEKWLSQMLASDLAEPNAMIVATVDQSGQVSQRYVLLKGVSRDGLVFFTDTQSQKGHELAQNPSLSLLFPWHAFERQVRIAGQAHPLPRDEVDAYFRSRPLGSQLAAYTSQQSQPIESRAELERRYQVNQAALVSDVELPERWGGYRVEPNAFEFWQGGEHRLHDRFKYSFGSDSWLIERLQP